MSFKATFRTGTDPKYYDNAIRLARITEAAAYGKDLAGRWLAVVDWRVEDSPDPVNYTFDGRLTRIES